MKKFFTGIPLPGAKDFPSKVLLAMKLTVLLLLVACLQVSAHVEAQNITYTKNNASLEKVFREIRKQTGYEFLYNTAMLKKAKKADLKFSHTPLKKALDKVFEDQPLAYRIIGKTIVVRKKEKHPEPLPKKLVLTEIKGTVVDSATGDPLVGVTIKVKSSTMGTTTDATGKFSLNVPDNAVLEVSYLGYTTKVIPVNGRSTIKILLKPATTGLDRIVVVGYGTQKEKDITGAVASIDSRELKRVNTGDLIKGIQGKLPGVRIKQRTSEPGTYNTGIWVRGFGYPLIIIDGMVADQQEFARLDPKSIESISVLKGASAAVYGVKSANGVVLVTTKTGSIGKPTVTYSGNLYAQIYTNTPSTMSAYQFMVYSDEVILNRGEDPGRMPYKPKEVQAYKAGEKKGTDWYDLVQKDLSLAQSHEISVSGGSEGIQYYTSVGFDQNMGMWKSGDLNYHKFNINANVKSNITDNLTMGLKLNAMKDRKNSPGAVMTHGIGGVFFSLFMQDPTVPVYANNTEPYLSETYDGQHPLAITNASIGGYTRTIFKTFRGNYSLTYQIPYVSGLSVKGRFGYFSSHSSDKVWNPLYRMYTYDKATDTYLNTATKNDPMNLTKTFNTLEREDLFGQIQYKKTFWNKHSINAQLIFESRHEKNEGLSAKSNFDVAIDHFFAGTKDQLVNSGNLFENRTNNFIGKVGYNFLSKYLVNFGFNMSGSSLFPENNRWGFFPFVSAGWKISEENFLRNTFPFITNLKIRGAWGQMGDDRAAAFQFIQGYTYGAGNYVFNDAVIPGLGFRNLANPNITWTVVVTKDIGLDFQVKNGLINFKLDFYRRDRSGLLATRNLSIPSLIGISLPQENIQSDMDEGFELVLGHSQKFADFQYNISGNIAFTRSKMTYVERSTEGNSYLEWRNNTINRYKDIAWGYKIDGQFTSMEEVLNSPKQHNVLLGNRHLLPGDIKYKDINNDGVINDMDVVPIGRGAVPDMNFGFNGSLSYKSFDMNFTFHGSTLFNYTYGTWYGRGLLWLGRNGQQKFFDRWHREDPLDPNSEWVPGRFFSAGINGERGNRANSEFWIVDASYFRLESLELGYTFKEKLLSKIGIKNLRLYFSGHNLFLWSKLKDVDPERGQPLTYPIVKRIGFGINLQF